jgi:hypothetical protein
MSTTIKRPQGWDMHGNRAMIIFGKEAMIGFVQLMPLVDRTFIVGSGTGYWGDIVNLAVPGHVILCDPAPGSYNGQPIHTKPDYPTIQDWLKCDDNTKGLTSTMWLNWSNPNTPSCKSRNGRCTCTPDTCDSRCDNCTKVMPYDMEAIRDLRPNNVVLVFEFTGHAGSSALIDWVINVINVKPKSSHIICRQTMESLERYYTINEYKEVARLTALKDTLGSVSEYIILWLSRDSDTTACPMMKKLMAAHDPPYMKPTELDMAYYRLSNGNHTPDDANLIAVDGMMMSLLTGKK